MEQYTEQLVKHIQTLPETDRRFIAQAIMNRGTGHPTYVAGQRRRAERYRTMESLAKDRLGKFARNMGFRRRTGGLL